MQLKLLNWQVSIDRVRSTTTELVTSYNEIAHVWDDKIHRLGFDRAYMALFAHLGSTLLPPQTGGSIPVLDCGIGTGALSLALCQQTEANIWLHGIDFSPKMVMTARQNLAAHGVFGKIETQDIRHLPYPDGSFPLVMSAHTLEHLDDPHAGLREMIRVLQPGGQLLLVMTRRSLLGSLLDAQWGLKCVTPKQIQQCLAEEGLVNVKIHQLAGPPWCRWMSLACSAEKPL